MGISSAPDHQLGLPRRRAITSTFVEVSHPTALHLSPARCGRVPRPPSTFWFYFRSESTETTPT
eukprot:147783-Prymnesium_polylepis.2